jgi:hypothetical protein
VPSVVEVQNMTAKLLKFQLTLLNRVPVRRALNPEYPEYFNGLPANPLLI